jgi:glycosyltransferase involved in cell wall biosynthesis
MKKVSVSVVIPCFNSERTILRSLESVKNQTVQVTEVICVDDSSDDNTLAIIRKFSAENSDLSIHVVENTINSGAGYSRNQAWDLATSNYIAFLDSDDAWDENKIFIQYSWMASHSHISVTGHNHVVSNNNSALIPTNKDDELNITPVSKFFVLTRSPFITPSIMIKRDVKYRFKHDKRYCEDYLLLAEMAMDNCEIVKINRPLVILFKEAFGVSGLSGDTKEMFFGEVDVYNILVKNSKLSPFYFYLLFFWSFVKYLRRSVIVSLR